MVSKQLQSKDMIIDIAITEGKGLISYFKKYRENSFLDALVIAKNIVLEMNVDSVFPQRREIHRKKHFDESANDDASPLSAKESFRVRLLSLDDERLRNHCTKLHDVLTNNCQSDIDGDELHVELKLLKELLHPEKMRPIDILIFLKKLDCLPNALIAYRILLTIPVTVASAERSFSKLKLLKSYLRSSMSQERLNGLAMIEIENNHLEKIRYEDLIDDFASRNAMRIALFK